LRSVVHSARTVLVFAFAAQAAVSVINFGLPAIGPELSEEFGLSLAELGAVLTATLLGSGLALVAAGLLVDRYGGRRATIAGSLTGAVGLAGAAVAPGTPALILLLVVSGVGTAVVPIAGIGSLFRAFPVERRAWALGIRQTAVPAGGLIGAVFLPLLANAGSARLALGVSAIPIALTGMLFSTVAGEAPADAAPPTFGLMRILRSPGMPRLLAVASCYIVVLQALLTYTVPSARDSGLSAFAAGAAYVALNITAAVARLVWGRLADGGGGTRRVQMLTAVGWVAAAGGVVFTVALHAGALAAILAAIVFSFGALGWNALVYVTAGERTPPELAGQSVALAATIVFVLSAVSAPAMGALADHASWDVFWLTTAGLAAAGAVVATGLRRPVRELSA
jgi:MFS family permease